MNYLLVVCGESGDGDSVIICASKEERNKETTRAIYGEIPESSIDLETVQAELKTLEEDHELAFEGDPPLRWIDAAIIEFKHKP